MILITGGAGYIGSHTLIELSNADYDFIVYDNLANSSQEALKRVEKIINKKIKFVKGDIRDKQSLTKVFEEYEIDLEGKNVVVVGASNIVGKPMASLLPNANATVTITHLYTKDLARHTREADIVIVAVGLFVSIT